MPFPIQTVFSSTKHLQVSGNVDSDQADLSDWRWSSGQGVFQNYRWMMQTALSLAHLLIPDFLRQKKVLMELCEKKPPLASVVML